MKHLWEVNHSYYCQEGNYAMAGMHTEFDSFEDFLEEYGDSDFDMNLVFRFDWKEVDEDTDEPTYKGDDNERCGKLYVFFMGQRKAKCWSNEVAVCRNDEPAVRAFLEPRFKHLVQMWEPFA